MEKISALHRTFSIGAVGAKRQITMIGTIEPGSRQRPSLFADRLKGLRLGEVNLEPGKSGEVMEDSAEMRLAGCASKQNANKEENQTAQVSIGDACVVVVIQSRCRNCLFFLACRLMELLFSKFILD